MPALSSKPQLVVFGPSHFCERARWGLDHAGITYTEVRWAPGPHVWLARRMGLRRTTTPILLLPSGTVVQGSSEILDHAGLGASDPALEQRCVERIGPLIRQFIYAATLRRAGSGVAAALVEGVSPGQAQAARLLWPLTRQLMAAGMQARPKLLPRLTQQIEIELAWLAGRLSSREDHGFDRSALTAASLLAPLAVPDECPVSPLYRRVQLPEEIGQIVERWRGEPVLVWVRQTYRMHRNRAS